MPAVRSRGRVAPSTPALVKAKKVIEKKGKKEEKEQKEKKAPRQPKERPECAICKDEMALKRETRVSCGHRFHWTCMINCLERKTKVDSQVCPMCRAPVGYLTSGKKRIKTVEAFGRFQQPSYWYMTETADAYRIEDDESDFSDSVMNDYFDRTLKFARNKTAADLKRVKVQLAHAIGTHKKDDYVEDIREEKEKLVKRQKIYNEMAVFIKECKEHRPCYGRRVEWNIDYERRCRDAGSGEEGKQKRRPHPESIYPRSDTDASCHSDSDPTAFRNASGGIPYADSDSEPESGSESEEGSEAEMHEEGLFRPANRRAPVMGGRGRIVIVTPPASTAPARRVFSAPPELRAPVAPPAVRTPVRRSVRVRNQEQASRLGALPTEDESDEEEEEIRVPRTRQAAAKEEEEMAGMARRLRSRGN